MNATSGSPRPSTLLTSAAIAATVLAGFGVALQSRINGELGQRLEDGFTAALISFGSGWLILAAIFAISARGRQGMRAVVSACRDGRLSWWMLLGGLGGAFFVLAQGLVAGIIGVAIFTIAIVTGQTLTGLLVDAVGFAGVRRAPLRPARVIGALITVGAVAVAVGPRLEGAEFPAVAILLPLVAGLAIGFQQAVNGRVRVEAQSALAATMVNFTVGTVALVTATLVHLLSAGLPETPPSEPLLYIGGALGVTFIAVQVVAVARVGVLVLGLSLVAGQLAAALLFDVVAPLGPGVSTATTVAVALAFAGVLVASIPLPRRGATRPSPPPV